jgi:hypothetical protein
MSIQQGILPFKIDTEAPRPSLTSRGGLPLVVEALRAVAARKLWKRLARTLGYAHWKVARRHLESLVLLVTDGGDSIDDLASLRAEPGLKELLGYVPSSASTAKDFLYRFHQKEDGQSLTAEDDTRLSV